MANDTRRPYRKAEFISRPEVGAIIKIVDDLAQGRPVDLRAFSLADDSGMGKTWTLRHLAEAVLHYDEAAIPESEQPEVGKGLCEIPGVHALYVDLLDWSYHFDGDNNPDMAIKTLIKNVSLRVSRWRNAIPTGILSTDIERVPLADLSRWLETDIRHFARESVFVLLLDQVHEAPWALLERLDQFLLGPLAAISRFLPVVAGRGQGYPWTSPEMWLHSEILKLKPFTEEQTQDQIRRQVPDENDLKVPIERIHRLSDGYPRLSYAIATLGELDGLRVELGTILQAMDEAVVTQVEGFLEVICVLRSFDDDRAVAMRSAQGKTITRHEAAEARKKLMRYSFAFWPQRGNGWVLDGSLRFTRERLLRLENLELFIRLHRAAYLLYEDWCEKYDQTRDIWQPEADYHALRLKEFELAQDPSQ